MWHGPLGVYGWVHDEEADGPRSHLVNVQAYLHGIPRAFRCRVFGHEPVVDGYGTPGQTWPSGESRAARWVTCGRCDTRPAWQGDLPPILFPTLGAPYIGQWVTEAELATTQQAVEARKEAFYQACRAWTPDSGEPRPTHPADLMPVWPSLAWTREGAERPGPRGAVHTQILVWQRKRQDFPGYGAGFSVGAGEQPLKAHVHAGKLGSVYVGVEEYGRAFAHRILGRDLPTTREFMIELEPAEATLRWELAARKHEWSSTDPWWMHGRVNFADLLLGKVQTESHVIDRRDVVIPLPEGKYPAHVELHRTLRRRGRIPRVDTSYRYDITPVCGVPVPGEGENSYDCGDDAYYSQSGGSQGPAYGSEWVTEAVASFVNGVLRARSRYGSGLAWVPDAGWPQECIQG